MDRYGIKQAIVQWEVGFALWHVYPEWFKEQPITSIWPSSRGYFSAKKVISKSIELMREKGLSKPIELAHRRMSARTFLLVKKILGSSPIIAGRFADETVDSFDVLSVQRWTKNWQRWIIREALARIHHLIIGWV